MSRADFTPEELKDARKMFKTFDEDGSGSITLKELGRVLRLMGQNPTTAELKDMILELDANGNGTIEFDEFLVMYQQHRKTQKEMEDEMKAAFDVFDKDKSGTISFKELKFVLKSMGEDLTHAQVKEMFKDADKNGDNRISFREFISAMK